MPLIQVRPERFVAGGETLARDVDGRVVFVRGGLPGELVDLQITEQKQDWSRGIAVPPPHCRLRRLRLAACVASGAG